MKVSEIQAEGFVEVCKLKDLSENRGKKFVVNETEVAVFLVSGRVTALYNICPHQHSSIIHDGFIEDDYVVCPAHGWMFSLSDGKQPDGRRGVDTYPVIILEDKVFIKVKKKSFAF